MAVTGRRRLMRCVVSWTPPGSYRVTIGVPCALFDTHPRATIQPPLPGRALPLTIR